MGNSSSTSASSSGASSSSGSSSASATSGNNGQYAQAKTDLFYWHSSILDEKLKYDVYLIKGEEIHYFLVMQEEGGKGCFWVELTRVQGKEVKN